MAKEKYVVRDERYFLEKEFEKAFGKYGAQLAKENKEESLEEFLEKCGKELAKQDREKSKTLEEFLEQFRDEFLKQEEKKEKSLSAFLEEHKAEFIEKYGDNGDVDMFEKYKHKMVRQTPEQMRKAKRDDDEVKRAIVKIINDLDKPVDIHELKAWVQSESHVYDVDLVMFNFLNALCDNGIVKYEKGAYSKAVDANLCKLIKLPKKLGEDRRTVELEKGTPMIMGLLERHKDLKDFTLDLIARELYVYYGVFMEEVDIYAVLESQFRKGELLKTEKGDYFGIPTGVDLDAKI